MNQWHLAENITCNIGQRTSAGIKDVNEDAIGIRAPDGQLQATKGIAAILADGVSAAEAAKEASEATVQGFLTDYFSTPDSWTVKKSAHQVISALNRWLFGQGSGFSSAEKGYICTLSAVVFKSQTAHIFHVGDSRVYLYRKGVLEQITRDHSRRVNKNQTFLTRAMGLDLKLDIDYRQIDTEEGDCFLLTTDGVHDFLNHHEITELLATDTTPDQKCQHLLELALANKSNDNLSCQIVELTHLPGKDVHETQRLLTQLPFPPDLSPGMILDGYKVLRTIHASNRSQLYVVEDQQTGQRYCMKTPSVNYEDDPAYIDRFVLVSWIGKRVQSSNVVKIIEPERSKKALYYLTEYIDGITLTQWIKEASKPSMSDVLFLVEQIGKGLRALHRREIIHQDIKPDNILISKEGVVKIIDFGSCLCFGISEIAAPIERDIVLGTANYSAPEHVLKNKITMASDTFSLAVITYEMITGQQPFHGKLEHCHSAQDYLRTKYSPAFEFNPLVPDWIDGALRKCLRFQPDRRYQEVDEFIYDLKHPNPSFLKSEKKALLQKSPLRFWQGLSAVLGITVIVLAMLLANQV